MFRNDIQILRAFAVSMVVLFHFWPSFFQGGFAGVDVFFVISGFLISSHLFAQVTNSGRIALASFWARRARRLLPAALFVIFLTLLFAFFFVPAGNKIEFAKEGLASTFYGENWLLALNSTNYFAQTTASPFQHYWSLAVEEQFYLVWPLLLAAIARLGWVKRGLPSAVTALTFGSFAFALVLLSSEPQFAYFHSFARVWEFGIGALLALPTITRRVSLSSKQANILAIFGFAGIVSTVFLFNENTPFPGFATLLPTLSTALVIVAGFSKYGNGLQKVLEFKPLNFVGGISYSLYLWHWPLILLPSYLLNGQPNTAIKIGLLILAVALSWLTKIFVEDKMRLLNFLVSAKPRRSLMLTLGISVLVAVTSVGLYSLGKVEAAVQSGKVDSLSNRNDFGANWLFQDATTRTTAIKPIMPLEQARHDGADPGASCMTLAENPEPKICRFGSKNSTVRVLLVGDSHIATHLGAFKLIAAKHNWSLTLAYKAGCSFNLVARNSTARGTSCFSWNQKLQTFLANEPAFNYVFTTSYVSNHLQDIKAPNWNQLAIQGFRTAWQPLLSRGSLLVAIRDNPEMNTTMTKCWNSAVLDASHCSQPLAGALHEDVSQAAAVSTPGVKTLDLTDFYCFNGKCPAVIGGVYVYRNPDHLGGTYDKSMANALDVRIFKLLEFQ